MLLLCYSMLQQQRPLAVLYACLAKTGGNHRLILSSTQANWVQRCSICFCCTPVEQEQRTFLRWC
jgi:hypothetical protein